MQKSKRQSFMIAGWLIRLCSR